MKQKEITDKIKKKEDNEGKKEKEIEEITEDRREVM